MKSLIRIFNFIIIGVSGLAIALLFINSSLSFNSRISFDANFIDDYFNKIIDQINESIPESETDPVLKEKYIEDINFEHVLGVNHINLSLNFDLTFSEVNFLMGKEDHDLINQELIDSNVHSIFGDLHEPVEILTEYTVRTVLKGVAKKEIYKQVKNALDDNPHASSTPLEVMDEVGLNDSYFRGFAKALFDAANSPDNPASTDPDEGCSVNTFVDVIFNRLKDALTEANAATGGEVSEDSLTEDKKEEIKNGFMTILDKAGLIREDGVTFNRISQVSYIFLARALREYLSTSTSVPASELDQKADETKEQYSERLSKLYVYNILPPIFYTIVGYTSLGVFISVIVFAAIWGILALITIFRTFSSKKPWTIFGPWFWIVGSLQIVLGLGLTIFCKFYLPGLEFVKNGLNGTGIQSFAIAPRTSALIPSMIFIGMIVFAIIYTIFAHSLKKEYRNRNKPQKPKEVVIHE